ncbi:MAG TPA: acyl-CoA dehydrogenase family protein [Acidimicrobiales bacterium]|jgi:alkylation response protein AidB-like acyl-CoA dehydrogenase|nr:acyl-CoA dehydrogenase family protein [Acidimicrobiales bacterium]
MTIDFSLGPESDDLREEVRSFLDEHLTREMEQRIDETGVHHDAGFVQAMRERDWLAPGWPAELGGQGMDPVDVLPIREEFARRSAPYYGIGITAMVAKVLAALGTEEQKAEILPKALNGEVLMALGFTEPECGSDVAAARTKAVRDGDEWVISGQKMFTTNGHIADYVFLLARTNPDAPKHKGLTVFLVPVDQPGFEAQAVYTLSGERTNITFYNELRVSDRWRIGGVDKGWAVMTHSLQDEHSNGFAFRSLAVLDHLERWASADGPDGTRPVDDPVVAVEVGRMAAEIEAGKLLQRRAVWMSTVGEVPEAEGPMAKLFTSEAFQRHAQTAAELLGPDGLRRYLDPSAPEDGRIEEAVRFSLGTTIYAGTSEVQRNIIAQRGLKLPRS